MRRNIWWISYALAEVTSLLRPLAILATITADYYISDNLNPLPPLTTSYLSIDTHAYHAHNTYICTKKLSRIHRLLHYICVHLLCTFFLPLWLFVGHSPWYLFVAYTQPHLALLFFQAVYISPYFICISHAHTAHTHTQSCNIFVPRTLAHVYDGFHEPERFSLPHSSFLIDLTFRFMPNHFKSQSTSRQIMLFMPPFMHPFFPSLPLIIRLPFSKKRVVCVCAA